MTPVGLHRLSDFVHYNVRLCTSGILNFNVPVEIHIRTCNLFLRGYMVAPLLRGRYDSVDERIAVVKESYEGPRLVMCRCFD